MTKKILFCGIAILMMSGVFWMGGSSFAQNCSSFSDCGGDENCLALQKDLCEDTCYGTWNSFTNTCSIPSTSSDCVASCISQGKSESECQQECSSVVTQEETPCDISTSKYFNDNNARKTTAGLLCECKKGFGDMPGAKNPNICQPCSLKEVCCGVKLNTNVPFIGNCIESSTQAAGSTVTETTAFPILVSSLVKILISVILITSFILIVVAGVRWSAGDAKGGKDMIIKVAIGLAILGASGVILRLINPNFFK